MNRKIFRLRLAHARVRAHPKVSKRCSVFLIGIIGIGDWQREEEGGGDWITAETTSNIYYY